MALRILVVEDDKHVRRILESLLANEPSLKSRAPEVVITGDGVQGLKALDQGPYDLVITDLLMPHMDGFEFCNKLRKHKFGASVPVIVTSAVYKDSAAQLRLRKEVGDHQFFAKPYEIRDLVEAVNRILDGNQPPPPALEIALSAAPPPPTPAELPETGTLADRAPPRLLLDLADRRATGTLSLLRGKVRKDIGIESGVLVQCDSNLRTETLGHFLVSRGLIDEKQHQAALTRAQARKELLGQALVELGWITEKALLHQLAAQMRAKVASVLRWQDGDWTFVPGAPAPRLQTPIEAALLVFLGLQKTAHVDEIAQLLARAHGRLSLSVRAERHRETFARVFGVAALDALGRRPLLADLMAGTDPAAMLTQLDALLTCGLAELQSADTPEPEPADQTDPVALERIAQSPPAAATRSDEGLYDQLFGDVPSEVMALPGIATPPPADAEALRKEILTEYLALPNRNYYEILGIPRESTRDTLAIAYARLRDRFRLERFSDVDLGRDYARMEALHQAFERAYDTLTNQRAEYDRKLAEALEPSRAPIDAELLASEAEALLFAGEADRARSKLELAVAAAPDVAHHHAKLGWATFLALGGNDPRADLRTAFVAAWPHLEQALAIDRDDREAHELAGRIAAAAGDDERAIPHLELALDGPPGGGGEERRDALSALEAIYVQKGAYKQLERRYRRLIHRLGDGRDPWRLELWARLAELYLTRLGDRESARVAYEMLARLAPEDPRWRQALAQLGGGAPAESPEAQFRKHLAAQRWDAAFVAAALAQADSEAAEFHRRYRPRFLQRSAPVDVLQQRHPDEDPDVGELLEQVLAAQPAAFSLGDLGVTDDDQVPHDFLPSPFRRALGHVCALLGLAAPPVYRRGDLGAEISPGASEPPLLMAGPQALANPDLPQLAFRLGRALSFLVGRRAAMAALPARQLKETLLAGFSLAAPQLRVDDPEGSIARLRAQLAQAAPQLARTLAPMADNLLKNPQLNLPRFVRGLGRTAERIGLVACHDPALALSLAQAPDELAAWALSDAHLALREQLGISVAV